MRKHSEEFLERIFTQNRTNWWEGLQSETPKKSNREAKCLQSSLDVELSDFPEYRLSDRMLHFFSTHPRSTIDGRFKSVGVEEKLNPLKLEETLIDGAIHRGLIWVVGNPHNLSPVEAVSLYVLQQGCKPIPQSVTDLYFPILLSIYKLGVQVVFVNGETGDHWGISDYENGQMIPEWLSVKGSPANWELNLEEVMDTNRKAMEHLSRLDCFADIPGEPNAMPGMGNSTRKARFKSIQIDNTCKIAIVENGDQWRVIEHGLLLRAAGFDAVRSIYNREMHKNPSDRTKQLCSAGRGVESRVADMMRNRYAIDLVWPGHC